MTTNTRLRDIIVAAVVGAVVSLAISFATNLWIMPLRDKQQRKFQITEQRLSNLYQPIIIATANGNFSLTSNIPFYKVYKVMEQYGYLSEPKLMAKYIEFLTMCRFASESDIFSQSGIGPEIPLDLLKELTRIVAEKEKPPLKWTPSYLEEALEKEKEFIKIFKEEYQRAYREFEELLK
jgi:hypothetical protein